MFIVVNRCYGGFELPTAFCEQYGFDPVPRTDARLVEWVRTHADEDGCLEEGYTCLKAVEIPSSATDWMIVEHDGLESIIYVWSGKLHRVF